MLSSLKKKNTWTLITVAVIAFLLGFSSTSLLSGTGSGLGGAAGALEALADCDTSPLDNEEPTGIVLADPLNFRFGPGLGYDIISQLDYCTAVSINGRTSDYAWLQVQLQGNIEGWVFAGYIKANVNYGDLEVATGFGGANTGDSSNSGDSSQNVSVIIEGNQAAAFIYGMPANTSISATLSPASGSSMSVVVANGVTDADGNTALTFTMPITWADGSDVESGTMTLTLTAGGATLTAWITYYTY